MESEIRIKGSMMKRRRSQLAQLNEVTADDKMISESLLRDMKRYADMDIDELLAKLSEPEMQQLSMMVDPDDSLIPASERCNYRTTKQPTGPLNRQKLLKFLEKFATEQEDIPEVVKFTPGVKRGRIWEPPVKRTDDANEVDSIPIELDIEESHALSTASTAELVDLASILGLHCNWASFEKVVKAQMLMPVENLPDNSTDPEKSAQKVFNDDDDMVELNWNNIRHIRRDVFRTLFDGLKRNTNLKALSLANTNLTDSTAAYLLEALGQNKHLRVLNVESNYLSGNMLKNLFEEVNTTQCVTELRAANQRPSILGNKVEMDIARLVEANGSLLSVGLHFDFADARCRVAVHLEKNLDKVRKIRTGKN